jgi:transposase
LATDEAQRIELLPLPPYAPDLNPAEGIWSYLKCVELKNMCCQNLTELLKVLRKAIKRLRHKQGVLYGCLRQPGLYV